jgi:hypothetical protein
MTACSEGPGFIGKFVLKRFVEWKSKMFDEQNG